MTKSKIIFENKTNTILDDGMNYLLIHKNGGSVCFSRDKKILNTIINSIKLYGNWQFNYKNSTGFFATVPKSSKYLYSLKQLIIAVRDFQTLKVGLREARAGKIKFKDGNSGNCTNENLEFTKGYNSDSIINEFSHDNNIIKIIYKHSGKQTVLDYSPELYKAVQRFRWGCKGNTNRFTTIINNHIVFLSHFAYCFYHEQANDRNIEKIVLKFKDHLNKNKLCVEHLKNNPLDNRKTNIHCTTIPLNVKKSDITDKIVPPFFEKCIFYKNYYGGYFAYQNKGNGNIQYFMIDDFADYVDKLLEFYNNGKITLQNGDDIYLPLTPKNNYNHNGSSGVFQIVNQVNDDKILQLIKENMDDKLEDFTA